MTRKKILIAGIIVFIIILIVAIGLTNIKIGTHLAEKKLGAMLENTIKKDADAHSGVLLIDAPRLGITNAWAYGIANIESNTVMTTNATFLSASIGKLFTATTVMTLVNDGLISLDSNITTYLNPDILSMIPVEGNIELLQKITLERLLLHRSGIPDYFDGKTSDGAPNIGELIFLESDTRWTPLKAFKYTKEHFDPVGKPDEVFTYSDYNYDLLGLIIEEVTGKEFHEVVKERVIDSLKLEHTWYYQKTDF